MAKIFKNGFKKAFDRLPHGEVKQAESDIAAILGIKSKTAFWLYKTGRKIPRADVAWKIIEYFTQKGITDVYE